VANLEQFTKLHEQRHDRGWIGPPDASDNKRGHLALNMHGELDAIHQHKAKDPDQVSVASSTHFTVVNGFGRANVRPKSSSLCSPGRQITILVVTMTLLFMIGIIGAIYLMDRE
jgi:hypothetical protein